MLFNLVSSEINSCSECGGAELASELTDGFLSFSLCLMLFVQMCLHGLSGILDPFITDVTSLPRCFGVHGESSWVS